MTTETPTGGDKPKPLSRTELTDQKLRLVRGLINKRTPVGEIKRLFAKHYGTTPRAAERFITDAYDQIRDEVNRDPTEHKADSYEFWRRIVANDALNLRERMRAQEQLDKILGTHAPMKTANTDTAGKDVEITKGLTSEEARTQLLSLLGDQEAKPCDD